MIKRSPIIFLIIFSVVFSLTLFSDDAYALECDPSAPTFTVVKNGDWDDPTIWDQKRVPGQDVKKVIPFGFEVTIGYSARVTNSCTINNNGILTVFGMLENTGTIDNFRYFYINAGLVENHGTINNSHHITIQVRDGTLNNFGSIINNRGVITIFGNLNNQGNIKVPQSSIIALAGGTMVNFGTVTIDSGAGMYFDNTGGTIQNYGQIDNSGIITNDSGTITNDCRAKFTNLNSYTGNPIQEIPCAPTILQPVDEVVDNPRPELIWKSDDETRPVQYSIALFMVDPELEIELESTGTFSAKSKNDLQNGDYEWRVTVAIDPSYNPGYPFVSQQMYDQQGFSIFSKSKRADPDGDGVGSSDNCPDVSNPDQTDSDGDGMGDACDATQNQEQEDEKAITITPELIDDMNTQQIFLSENKESTPIPISGKVPDYNRGTLVEITIQKPDGKTEDMTVYAKKTGEYSTFVMVDDTWEAGEYIVVVKYQSEVVDSFLVEIVDQNIPSWIKSSAEKWANGRISDNTFLQSIQYLIKSGTIKASLYLQGSAFDSNQIPSWTQRIALWWSNEKIDDNTFLQATQYLLQVGVIKIYETAEPDGLVQQGITTISEEGMDAQAAQKQTGLAYTMGIAAAIIGIAITASLISLRQNKKSRP